MPHETEPYSIVHQLTKQWSWAKKKIVESTDFAKTETKNEVEVKTERTIIEEVEQIKTPTVEVINEPSPMPKNTGFFGKKQDDILKQKKEDIAEKMKQASIELTENTQTNQVAEQTPQANNTFNQEQLETVWYNFIAQLDKGSLSFMKERKITIQDNTNIHVIFANNHERSLFDENKLNGLQYLRTNLKNTEITLNFEIDSTLVPEVKTLSPDEKFNKMVAQNPHLASLRQLLELEIDY